jgi:hypothetical protein
VTRNEGNRRGGGFGDKGGRAEEGSGGGGREGSATTAATAAGSRAKLSIRFFFFSSLIDFPSKLKFSYVNVVFFTLLSNSVIHNFCFLSCKNNFFC